MSDTIDTKDTKEAGDMLPAMSADEKMIQDGFNELLQDYLNSNHRRKVERITKAFNFANQAHAGVKRRSGEPYIMHPIAVARIVCREMGLGSTSICSALLHDVVEDTEYTVQDISDMFGPKIAQIVDGLTKISGGIFGEQASAQAENFRKLLLTMSDDIRVILIKIADRLHNMRTLGSMLPAKQFKIAGETLYLYAPLAHRLGLFTIKTELEDLSFKYEHPHEYDFIEKKLQATEESRNKLFEHFAVPVDKKLKEMGLHYEMQSRVKSAYSIWNKMESKGITFEDIYDLYKHEQEIMDIEGFGKKSMDNLVAAIEKSKENDATKVLTALGISNIGKSAAKSLMKKFKTMDQLMNASYEQLIEVNDIGDTSAQILIDYFKDEKNKEIIHKLEHYGLKMEIEDTQSSSILENMTFVVTGTLPTLSRKEAATLIENNGGKVSGSVSKKTTYLLAGENAGSKLTKAQSLNIPVLTEEMFMEMIKS